MKAPLTLRVEVSDLADWQKRANLKGLSLSEWVRRQCNDAEAAPIEDVPRTEGVHLAERSTPASERRTRPRSSGKLKEVEDVTHEAVRKNLLCRHNLLKSVCTICGS